MDQLSCSSLDLRDFELLNQSLHTLASTLDVSLDKVVMLSTSQVNKAQGRPYGLIGDLYLGCGQNLLKRWFAYQFSLLINHAVVLI